MKEWNNDIPENLRQFHDGLIDFVSLIQTTSNQTHAQTKSTQVSRGAFFILHAYAIDLHRSVLSLCDNGWSQITPMLLRVMLDIYANSLVIAERDFEYRACKYFYFYHMKVEVDEYISEKDKARVRAEFKRRLNELEPPVRARIEQFAKKRKFGTYWFNPEYKGPSHVLRNLAKRPSASIFMYRIYSEAIHGGHVGANIFLDKPDKVDINPRSNPNRAKLVVINSCRHLLDICDLRIKFEKLPLGESYQEIMKEFHSLKLLIP